MEIKKRNLKVTKAYIQQTQEISPEEQYENYKAVYAKVIQEANPKITKIANTNMDKAVRKNKKMEVTQKQDYSQLLDNDNLQEERLYLFETDKILDEETKGVASGY